MSSEMNGHGNVQFYEVTPELLEIFEEWKSTLPDGAIDDLDNWIQQEAAKYAARHGGPNDGHR